MSTRAIRGLALCLLGLIGLFTYEISVLLPEANAIPAFARKYGVSCNVCHVPGFPKLNDFGNQFRDQGYQFDADVDLPTNEKITMGFWPVSMRTTVGYQAASVRTDGSGVTTGGFGFTGLDILSSGLLHRDISFGLVFTPGLGSAGFGTGASSSDLEATYVRLNRLERFLGVKGEQGTYLMNLKVGKFELDVPFSEKRSPTLNTKFVLYHYVAGTPYTATIGGTSTSTYRNPNAFALGNNSPGIELAGITKTAVTDGVFRYSLAGLSTNTDAWPGGSTNCPANATCGTGGRNVNFYGHMTQSFGGYGIVTGHRIGLFGAYGNAPTVANATCPGCQGVAGSGQPFYRIGADVSFTYMDNGIFLARSCMGTTARISLCRKGSQTPRMPHGTAGLSSWIGIPLNCRWPECPAGSSPIAMTSSEMTGKAIRHLPRTTITSTPIRFWPDILSTSQTGPILHCMQNTTPTARKA